MKGKHQFPFHPFLLAIYPVLALLAHNLREVSAWVAVRPMLISLAGSGLLFGVLMLAVRDVRRAALVSSLGVALFFAYGHVYNFLAVHPILGFSLGRNRYLAPIFLVVLIAGIWLILRQKRYLAEITQLVNGMAVVLLCMPLLQMGGYAIRQANSSNQMQAQADENSLIHPGEAGTPDVYYIILDMYTRQDVLQEKFGLDTSAFINELQQLGFTVADCSNANYPSTNVSLASSLNMSYLQDIAADLPAGATVDTAMRELLHHNQVRRLLEQAGYRTVSFATGYDWIDWKDASEYLEPSSGRLTQSLRPFEAMLIQSTAVSILLDAQTRFMPGLAKQVANPNQEHVRYETFLLEKLGNLASMPGPKFVYAHILIPHGPFVFNADGSLVPDPSYYESGDEERYIEGYRNQVEYINQRLLEIIPRLLKESKQPPIIIIQGDHGPKEARFPILNAYYLPGGANGLYPTISPVNSFRLVFDQFFGAKFALLPDQSYQVEGDDLMDFASVDTDGLTACPADGE
jgi:hypothetical protein